MVSFFDSGEHSVISAGISLTFTGGRRMTSPADSAAFNAKRYAWVKKRFERTDVAPGASAAP